MLPKFVPKIVSCPFKADTGLIEEIVGENLESNVKLNCVVLYVIEPVLKRLNIIFCKRKIDNYKCLLILKIT